MNRTTVSLIAGVTALAAVTGFASVSEPGESAPDTARTATRLPVERTSLLCPAPSTSDLAETAYTSFTPVTKGTGSGGGAALVTAGTQKAGAADDGAEDEETADEETGDEEDGKAGGDGAAGRKKPFLTPKEPGKPFTGEASGAESPALVGTAEGRFAPGWAVQQTTRVEAGTGRGLLGTACSAPDTDFWFPGAGTAEERTDYVHLTNPDDSAAVADIELYGKDGTLKSTAGEGIKIPPHADESVLLSTLVDEPETDLTVHVTVRSGRVAAAVQVLDDTLGGDWLAPSAAPAAGLVLPGIPKDATSVRLVAFAPGETDADLKVRLASPTGPITPAGHETLHVKAGMTAAVDLGDLTRGEAGSLMLTPTGKAVPVVAALRVVRGKGGNRETAFIPATAAVGVRATAADNRSKGSTLSLVAPGRGAEVRVTASAGSGGGTAASKTYRVKAGTTQNVPLPVPSGLKGTYALTVEPLSGGPVHAARLLELPEDGVPMFTVQTLPDDRGTVKVPEAEQDLSVLMR